MIIRNWNRGEGGHIIYSSFAVDIGNNALFEFMLSEPVKGSGNEVYVIEPSGPYTEYSLFKRHITLEEYEYRGGRHIPISDALLHKIADW